MLTIGDKLCVIGRVALVLAASLLQGAAAAAAGRGSLCKTDLDARFGWTSMTVTGPLHQTLRQFDGSEHLRHIVAFWHCVCAKLYHAALDLHHIVAFWHCMYANF